MRFRVKKGPIIAFVAIMAALFGYRYWKMQEPGELASAEPPTSASPSASLPQPSVVSVRFCGSNTIGAELAPALAEEFLRSKGASSVRRENSSDVVVVGGSLPGDLAPFTVDVRSGGTGTAFSEMASGRCDIAMASRPASESELSQIGPGHVEHVLGLDGIAVIVNQSSPVSSLTVPQVASLFSGSSDWSSVGGSGPVDVVSYDEKSGTFDTFKMLVLGPAPLSASSKRFSSSSDVIRSVSSSPGAVAYTSLASARGVKILAVADKGTEAVVPTQWTVGRETYALTRRLFLYTHSKWTRPAADSLVLFSLSERGQSVVSRSGFVDLNVRVEQSVQGCSNDDCPPEYMKATWGMKRLSVDFRFQRGSTSLDSRALADIGRVSSVVKSGSSVRLIGFADNSGNPVSNQRLSLARSEAVKDELSRGVQSPIFTSGLGAAMPVASNDTEDGRQRNRRVEVWVSDSK